MMRQLATRFWIQIRLFVSQVLMVHGCTNLIFFFKNVEYTKVVAAAYRCSNLVDECGFCVKQAEDRISTANFPEAVASSMVAFIENEISVLNLHGHWEFH